MRGRRAAAWLIDTGPQWLAIALVGPAGFAHALLLRQDAAAGVEPSTDRVAQRLFELAARASGIALLLLAAWAIIQLTALLAARRTVGKSLLGLGVAAAIGATDIPARGRVVLRELTRFALLAALPIAYTTFAFPHLVQRASWEFFSPFRRPAFQPWSIWTTLIVVGGLMIGAVSVTLWEAILVAGDPAARTLGDRVARTRVVRRDA